jgi:hypothetical protein
MLASKPATADLEPTLAGSPRVSEHFDRVDRQRLICTRIVRTISKSRSRASLAGTSPRAEHGFITSH